MVKRDSINQILSCFFAPSFFSAYILQAFSGSSHIKQTPSTVQPPVKLYYITYMFSRQNTSFGSVKLYSSVLGNPLKAAHTPGYEN